MGSNSRQSNFSGRSWPNYDNSNNSLAGELRFNSYARSRQNFPFRDQDSDDDRGNHSYTQLCQSLNSSSSNYTQPQLKRSYPECDRTAASARKEQKVEKPKKQSAKKKPAVKKPVWGFRKDTIMLEYFKDHRNLWDTADGNFGNADITKKSLQKLAKELNCKVSNVKTRFRKFRERFLLEVNKLENAERLGSEYSVSWKYFSNLLFLLGNKAFEAGIVKAEIILDDVESTVDEIGNQTETPSAETVVTSTIETVLTNNNQTSTVNTSPTQTVKVEVGVDDPLNNSVMTVEQRLDLLNAVSSTPRVSASPVVSCTARVSASPVVSCTARVSASPAVTSSPAISASPAIPTGDETLGSAFCSNVNNNNASNSFQITENVHLDSELFGKQVAIHLNNLSPYYREISKLRMQEIMVHFALRSQGFHPPLGLRPSQPNNSQMD